MYSENRNSPRIPKELTATAERVATVRSPGESRIVPIRIVDVSHEGIGFVSPEPFHQAAFVRVTLTLSSEDGKAAMGRVYMTSLAIRNCSREKNSSYRVRASYKIGALVKGQTPQEYEAWHELIRKWEPKLM